MKLRQVLVYACFSWKLFICQSVERLIPGHKGIFNPMRQLLDAFSFCIASFLCSHAVAVGRLLLSTGVAHYSCHEYVYLFIGEREGLAIQFQIFFFMHYIITQQY